MSLYKYKSIQSKLLKDKLDAYTKLSFNKHKDFDDIPKNSFYVIECKKDIEIINKLIDLQSFILLPVSNDKGITHVYSIGLWYYYGIPDIVINFENEITENQEFIQTIYSSLHEKLFELFESVIIDEYSENTNDIILRHKFEKDININIKEFQFKFNMKRINEKHYMNMDCSYMVWFDTYFMKSNNNENIEYPIYQIRLTKNEYNQICNSVLTSLSKFVDKIKTKTINEKYIIKNKANKLESIDSDSESDSDSSISIDENKTLVMNK